MKNLEEYVRRGRFYESVVEDGSDIIFVIKYDGTILYHNNSTEEVLGYKPKSLTGKNFLDYVFPEALSEFKKHFNQS
jgi:PAS domain S-box-containing protein